MLRTESWRSILTRKLQNVDLISSGLVLIMTKRKLTSFTLDVLTTDLNVESYFLTPVVVTHCNSTGLSGLKNTYLIHLYRSSEQSIIFPRDEGWCWSTLLPLWISHLWLVDQLLKITIALALCFTHSNSFGWIWWYNAKSLALRSYNVLSTLLLLRLPSS